MVWAVGGVSVLLVVFILIGLYDLIRNRHTMEPSQVVIWAALIVLVPAVGLIAYLFWRLFRTQAMLDSADYFDKNRNDGGKLPPIKY